jgi:hypothetical protein
MVTVFNMLHFNSCLVSSLDGELCHEFMFCEGWGVLVQDAQVPIRCGASPWNSNHTNLQSIFSSRQWLK